MIKSMTSFGRSKYENDSREYSVEIKTVNNRYSDVSIKLSRSISYLEEKVKKMIDNYISRGKVDVYINFTNNSEKGKNISLNKEMAKIYIKELKELANETGIIDNTNIMDVCKLPDVLTIENNQDEGLIWSELSIALKETLETLVTMREIEGNKMKQDIENRIKNISINTEKISEYSTGLIQEYVVKLEARIKEILKSDIIDENRLAQEVVIYSDKCSIEEEKTRLNSHIEQFLSLLEINTPVGKKLDFLLQEMNREVNTIGSKANNLEITKIVVDTKAELENIREQIQNIE